MGRFTGFQCDLCDTATEGAGREKNDTPFGWFTVNVRAEEDIRAGSWLLCSNRCLARLGRERMAADKEAKQRAKTLPTDDKERAAARTARLDHIRFHVETEKPDEHCVFCQEATAG